ncbi:short-chain dehydrogenase [Pseudomonas tohonis]|uniref:Short-chain dehydrogenase n=1 Tax=Pseudomonas tohonis TaxID=2725477 RepID=A0A6J4E7D4_9PSED|nr:SDR family oxidoreductase [Pseudomonas tohonis]BCG25355.1 short-chain dehydrogenase [Pseudomonas tohonis]GJN54815.1 short-chain dehydrogenase [Pseudomonas tohonis]
MTNMQELKGKVVVLTGASSGIGRVAAYAFAARGARLVLAARDGAALEETAEQCRRLGGEARAVPTDVTQGEAVQALADTTVEHEGRIDVWINNAGVGSVGSFEETPLQAHEQVVQTDLLGYLRGAHAVLPQFKRQGSGVLINTLSVGSWVAQPYAASYSAAKFGLVGFTEALRGELADWPDIHVCNLYPAVIDTPGFRDGANYTGHRLSPPSPIYDPEQVAEAMLELACAPRPIRTVGAAAHWLRLAHFLTPGFTRLLGRGTARAIDRAPLAGLSSGNLFGPPSGRRQVHGGWASGGSQAGLAAAAAVAALGAYLLYRARQKP